jgi:hypothetical protein
LTRFRSHPLTSHLIPRSADVDRGIFFYPVFVLSPFKGALVENITANFGELMMKKRVALNILILMAIGAVFLGISLSPMIRNVYLGPAIAMVIGMYISWLIAAAVRENEKLNNADV